MEKQYVAIKLLFTRHGETEDNAKGVICGQQPGQLTKTGRDQAKKIGVYFKNQGQTFDFIYVSDLGRTVATFENIKSQAKELQKIPVTLTKLIREKCGGIYQGKPLGTWKQQADKQKKGLRQYKCSKGESWEDVNSRCFSFLKLLVETHILKQKQPKNNLKILAVAHGGVLMEFHNLVGMLTEKREPVFKNTAKNCSFHEFLIEYPLQEKEFSFQKVRISCVRQNFVDHLK